jgi:hypothetical protein
MHEVEALIAEADTLALHVRALKGAVTCPLTQGLALLPLTDEFVEALAVARPQKAPLAKPPGETIGDAVAALALEISQATPVVYIITGYFGGQGGQDAFVWHKGSLTFSPATPGYDQVWPNSPISQALRTIGVVAQAGLDEFDTVGLGRHRHTLRWAQSAQ